MLDNIIQKCINKKCKYKTLKNTSRIVINKSLKRKHNKLLGGDGAPKPTKFQKFKSKVSSAYKTTKKVASSTAASISKKAASIRNSRLNNPETKATQIQSMNINKLNANTVLKRKGLFTKGTKSRTLAKYTVRLPITATVKIADIATKKLTNAIHYLRSDVTAKHNALKTINNKVASVLAYQKKLHELALTTDNLKQKEALFKKLEKTDKLSNKLSNKQKEIASNSDSTLNRTLHNIGKDINYAYENKKESIKRIFKNIGWRMALQRNRVANNLEKTAEMYQKRIDALNSEGSGGYKLTTKQKDKRIAKLTRIRNNLIENAKHNRRIGQEMKSNSMFTYFTRSAERSEIKHGRSILIHKPANTNEAKIKAVLEACPNIKKALKSMNIPVNDISKLGDNQRERLLKLYNTVRNKNTRTKDASIIENIRRNFLNDIIEDKAGNNIESATFKRHTNSRLNYPPVNIRTMSTNEYANVLNRRLDTLTGKNYFNKLVSSDEFKKRAISNNDMKIIYKDKDNAYTINEANNQTISNIKIRKRDLAIEKVKLLKLIDDDTIDALTKINAQNRIDEINTILGYDNSKHPEAFSKALELGNYNTIKKLIDAGENNKSINNIKKQINADYDIKKASNDIEAARQTITEINKKLSKTTPEALHNDIIRKKKLQDTITQFTDHITKDTKELKEKTGFLNRLSNLTTKLTLEEHATIKGETNTNTNATKRNIEGVTTNSSSSDNISSISISNYINKNTELLLKIFDIKKVGILSINNNGLFNKLREKLEQRSLPKDQPKDNNIYVNKPEEVEFIKKMVEDSANLNKVNIDLSNQMIIKTKTEINAIDTKVKEFGIMTQQKEQAEQKLEAAINKKTAAEQKLKAAEETRKAAEAERKAATDKHKATERQAEPTPRTLQLNPDTNPNTSEA